MTREVSGPRQPTDENIAARIQTGISTAFSVPSFPLMLSLASRPPQQRRYIDEEAKAVYRRKHEELLAAAERFGLPKGDAEAFAFFERRERDFYDQKRSVLSIQEERQGNFERHHQWMKAVKHIPKDEPSHAHTIESEWHTRQCLSTFVLVIYQNLTTNCSTSQCTKHERQEEDEEWIRKYDQVFEQCQMQGPEHKLIVTDAGYSSVYLYQKLQAIDLA